MWQNASSYFQLISELVPFFYFFFLPVFDVDKTGDAADDGDIQGAIDLFDSKREICVTFYAKIWTATTPALKRYGAPTLSEKCKCPALVIRLAAPLFITTLEWPYERCHPSSNLYTAQRVQHWDWIYGKDPVTHYSWHWRRQQQKNVIIMVAIAIQLML